MSTGIGHTSRRRLAAPGLALAAALLALQTAPARADTWTEDVPDSLKRFSLESIDFEGDYGLSKDELKGVIRSSTSGLLRFRPVDLERVEGDVYRLRSHFRRNGYWNASVDRRIEFENTRRKTRVTFVIHRGVQRVVGGISVSGNQSFATEEILGLTKQKQGDPFDYNQTARDRTAIENTYANQGFFEVQVTADIQPASAPPDSGPAPPDTTGPRPVVHDLVFRIEEGTRYSVGQIRIEGHEITKDDIILRELTFGPGDVLNREELARSRSHLYATGYFSRVELVPQVKDAEEGHVDLVIRVTERKMRFVNGGIGYGTRDQLRTSGSWGHRNLWGRGKRAEIDAIVATELVPKVDLVRTTVTGRYVEPWLLGTRTTGTAELTFERSREFSTTSESERVEYDLNRTSLILSANRQLARYTKGWLGVESEWADIDAGERASEIENLNPTATQVTRTIGTQIDHDRRDHLFNPENGFVHRFIGSLSGGPLGGDNDFWKTQLESGWFRRFPFGVFGARLRVGYERPFGKSDIVPDRERFKLGGESTVRGYKEQDIGPGDFMLLGNVETRVPLFWKLETAAFLDGGNAWNSPSEVSWEDFRLTESENDPNRAFETEVRYSWGFGLRFRTPVGPVRLDWARKFKILPVQPDRGSEDKSRWHLSLGHVF